MHRNYKGRSLSCSAQCESTSSKGCHIGRFWRNKHKQGFGAGSSGEFWGNFRCSFDQVTNSLEKWWRIIPALSGINYTELYLKCEEYHIINWGPGWDKNVASPFHKLEYILLLSLLLSQSSLAFSLQDLLYQQILKFSGLPSLTEGCSINFSDSKAYEFRLAHAARIPDLQLSDNLSRDSSAVIVRRAILFNEFLLEYLCNHTLLVLSLSSFWV